MANAMLPPPMKPMRSSSLAMVGMCADVIESLRCEDRNVEFWYTYKQIQHMYTLIA